MTLKGKTLFVTGASRGIGLAIALRAARDGASIAIVAKTTEPHPKLPGTIYSAATAIEHAGGTAIAIACDIQEDDQVAEAIKKTVDTFGNIDILVNNASAIHLTGTVDTPMKRFDLMHRVNTRGTFLCSKLCIPYLKNAANPHILNLSPPLNMEARWFAPHLAYTMAKFGMSMCVLGMADELRPDGIAVNALWPRTTIETAAVRNLLGGEAVVARSRKPEVMADAAHWILTRPSREFTGHFCIDDETLAMAGKTDLSEYAVNADSPDSRLLRVSLDMSRLHGRRTASVGDSLPVKCPRPTPRLIWPVRTFLWDKQPRRPRIAMMSVRHVALLSVLLCTACGHDTPTMPTPTPGPTAVFGIAFPAFDTTPFTGEPVPQVSGRWQGTMKMTGCRNSDRVIGPGPIPAFAGTNIIVARETAIIGLATAGGSFVVRGDIPLDRPGRLSVFAKLTRTSQQRLESVIITERRSGDHLDMTGRYEGAMSQEP